MKNNLFDSLKILYNGGVSKASIYKRLVYCRSILVLVNGFLGLVIPLFLDPFRWKPRCKKG